MSRDEDAKNARLFDRRTVERNIKKGLVSRKDYDKYMKALGDAAEKAAPLLEDDDPGSTLEMPAALAPPSSGGDNN